MHLKLDIFLQKIIEFVHVREYKSYFFVNQCNIIIVAFLYLQR